MERRPIKTRSRQWAHGLSGGLLRAGLTPNQVSLLGIVFALMACVLLMRWGMAPVCLLLAAGCVQLRLLCNMLDGLMAIEGGRPSKTGELLNEFPDRVEDVAILVGAGHAAGWVVLGWAAAVGAVLTAYVRAFGGGLGQGQDFSGPMAKPHRMFVMTLGCVVGAVELWAGWRPRALGVALAVVLVGTVATVIRRTWRLARRLGAQ